MTLAPAMPRAAALTAALLLTVLAAPAAAETTHDGRTVLSVGHTDAMQAYLDGDQLKLQVKDDTGDETLYHHPDDVLFQVLPEAEIPIPAGDGFSFLGDAGDPMWLLPLNQDHDLLWPGWSTEPLSAGQLQNDKIKMTLENVEGPGDVALWSPGNLGDRTILFNTRDGLPDSIDVRTGSHVHTSWSFMAEGEYTLTWKISGALADGTAIESESYEYQWVVGDLPDEEPGGGTDPGGDDPTAPGLDDRLVLDQGHVDVFGVTMESGALDLSVKDGTGLHGAETYRDPDDVVFHAVPESELEMTQEQIDFWHLGDRYSAGDTVWWLPEFDKAGILFAGWNTDVASGELQNDEIALDFIDFNGPGDLLMFMPADPPIFDGETFADTTDGLPDTVTTTSKTHAHANWLFSEPGVYTLTWQARTTLAGGTSITSDPEEFVFVVGEWPADGGDPDDPDDPGNPELENTQTITATVDTDAGGLVISVDPNDRDVLLPAMALNNTATRWTTEGELRPVTVTDTRSADPGWNAAAQVSEFSSDEGGFTSDHLGWLPGVVSSGDSQQVTPGPTVQGELDGGPGLSTSQILAAAAAGSGKGTCVLGADLQLDLPTDVESGTYTALVTFTAI